MLNLPQQKDIKYNSEQFQQHSPLRLAIPNSRNKVMLIAEQIRQARRLFDLPYPVGDYFRGSSEGNLCELKTFLDSFV